MPATVPESIFMEGGNFVDLIVKALYNIHIECLRVCNNIHQIPISAVLCLVHRTFESVKYRFF